MVFVFFLSAWLGIVSGCARTSDSGTGATLPPSVTTTVPGATTTAAGTSCNGCTQDQVALNADPNDGENGHAPTSALGAPQNGCVTLIITCTPLPVNEMAGSLVTFNGLDGTPGEGGQPITATLLCNTMGQFQIAGTMGVAITSAHCFG